MAKDDTPSTKTVKILLKLLAAPRRLTKRQLGEYVGLKDRSDVRNHLRHLEAAGLTIKQDEHHRHYVVPGVGHKELTYLAPLSDADKNRIKGALQQLPAAEALQLGNKLDALYDYQALGLEALRRPEIDKLDALEEAIRLQQRVVLVGYRSRNSNDERDRTVEPFGVEPEIGMLRAYDPEKLRTSHFMLRRFDRVEILDQPWMYTAQHSHHPSDAFNIVDKRTVLVDLTLSISAYNDLIERNPLARQYVRKGSAPDTYQFQGRVNAKFVGLLSFILANWQGVQVHGPEQLRQRLTEELEAMCSRLSGAQLPFE